MNKSILDQKAALPVVDLERLHAAYLGRHIISGMAIAGAAFNAQQNGIEVTSVGSNLDGQTVKATQIANAAAGTCVVNNTVSYRNPPQRSRRNWRFEGGNVGGSDGSACGHRLPQFDGRNRSTGVG